MADAREDSFARWRAKVRGTNISEATLLATDYLNHFNEIVMLLEMVPDMPDMLEECKYWKPKSYQDHFRDSGFSDRDLAVEAYDHVPERFKTPFEETVRQMNRLIEKSIDRMENQIKSDDMALAVHTARAAVGGLQRLIEITAAIIHGSAATMTQDEIDAMGF